MFVLALVCVSIAGAIEYRNYNISFQQDGDEYYCNKCKVKLMPRSKNVWTNTKEKCKTCGGDGKVNDVDKDGHIIPNGKVCPICDGGCYEKKLTIVNYLHCSKCKKDYSYPKD